MDRLGSKPTKEGTYRIFCYKKNNKKIEKDKIEINREILEQSYLIEERFKEYNKISRRLFRKLKGIVCKT